jgi:hypothetical protein
LVERCRRAGGQDGRRFEAKAQGREGPAQALRSNADEAPARKGGFMKLGEHWKWRNRNLASGEGRKESPPTTPPELAERQEADRLNQKLVLISLGDPEFEETAPGVNRLALDGSGA